MHICMVMCFLHSDICDNFRRPTQEQLLIDWTTTINAETPQSLVPSEHGSSTPDNCSIEGNSNLIVHVNSN